MLFLQKPRYYDAPDGHAPVDKLVATMKKASLLAIGTSIIDCVYVTGATTPLQAVNCVAFWVVPTAGLVTTWSGVTYAATNIRGKDDPWNYGIGALACFPILHAWSKNTQFSWWATAALAAATMIAKSKHTNNWVFLPEKPRNWGIYQHDWSLTKEYDKDFRTPYDRTLY